MNDRLQPLNLHSLIKGPLLRNILHNLEIQLRTGMGFCQEIRLLLGSHGRGYGVSAFEEDIEDVGSDEA